MFNTYDQYQARMCLQEIYVHRISSSNSLYARQMFIPIYNNETQESEVKVKMVAPLSESEYALVFSVPPFNFQR